MLSFLRRKSALDDVIGDYLILDSAIPVPIHEIAALLAKNPLPQLPLTPVEIEQADSMPYMLLLGTVGIFMSMIDEPFPHEDLEFAHEDDLKLLTGSRASLFIGVKYLEKDKVVPRAALSLVTVATLKAMGGRGVFVPNASKTRTPDQCTDALRTLKKGRIPTLQWMTIGTFERDDSDDIHVITFGLEEFGSREIEWWSCPRKHEEAALDILEEAATTILSSGSLGPSKNSWTASNGQVFKLSNQKSKTRRNTKVIAIERV